VSNIDDLLDSTGLRRQFRPRNGKPAVYLHAGQLHVATEATEITTVLGSCVAVCVWDPVAGVGGMCHYMLPDAIGGKADSARYAKFAVRELIDGIVAKGGLRHRLKASVYGGGTMLNAVVSENDLGSKNVKAATEWLEKARVPVVDQQVRGNHGRRLVFQTNDGSVEVRRVG
jgi:chemotaxis protein CheD